MDELISAARSGDEVARDQLLTSLRPRIRQWAVYALSERMSTRIDASDLTQITLLDVHKRLDQFVGTTDGEFIEWLRRTLQRNIVDEVRRATAMKRDIGRENHGDGDHETQDPVDLLPARYPSPGSQLILLEDRQRLRLSLSELPLDQQNAIRMVYVEHIPVAEAAIKMGRSTGAVAKLIMRGIEALRRKLKVPDSTVH